MTKPMTFKSAARRATEIQVYVSCNGCGFYIEASRAAVMRSDLYHDAPRGKSDRGGQWIATDDDGRCVWAFDGGLLQIG